MSNEKNSKIFSVLQRVGRSFMLPIAVLPVAGLMLGVGASFTNPTVIAQIHAENIIYPGSILYGILNIFGKCGDVIFGNLPIIFAISVAIGMAKQEKAVAALAGAVSYFVMNAAVSASLQAFGKTFIQDGKVVSDVLPSGSLATAVGIEGTLQMGVFGGIIVGFMVSYLHNKYYKVQFNQVLSFFEGTRFIPIISSICGAILGIILSFVWPYVLIGINQLGVLVRESGAFGIFIYGFIERALIPFGLHHVFYLPFWSTSVGGTMEIAGKVVEGGQNIFFAQLADTSFTGHFSTEATKFFMGKYPFMMFGLPAAALAMYNAAKPEKKSVVKGLLLSAAITSFLTGITEPIEFTFLFVAPFMYYGIHCVLAGLSFMILYMLNVAVGATFSSGFIDFFLYGIIPGPARTDYPKLLMVGVVYAVIYYFVFYFLITKLNLKTPGREDSEEVKLYNKADYLAKKSGTSSNKISINVDEQIALIAEGLGGLENVVDLDSCATRLRTTVKDSKLVDQGLLKSQGAAGVVINGSGVQVIFGPKVSVIKSNLEEYWQHYLQTGEKVEFDINNSSDTKLETEQVESKNIVSNDDNVEIYSPIVGEVIPTKDIPDAVFAEELLGKTIGIVPTEGVVYAPCDAKIALVYDTLHAIALTTNQGIEMIIHVGIDTVKLKGEPYKALVKVGDTVKKGDRLLEFNIDMIKEKGYSVVTPFIITNDNGMNHTFEEKLGSVDNSTKLFDFNK